MEEQRVNLLRIKQTEKELQLLKDEALQEMQAKLADLKAKKSLSKRSRAIKQMKLSLTKANFEKRSRARATASNLMQITTN